jgi:hypothetical protein
MIRIIIGLIVFAIGWYIYGGWVNPFEPINKGRLGSTQEWRIEKPKRHYY